MNRSSSFGRAYERSESIYRNGGTRFAIATAAWLLVSVVALGVGVALLAGVLTHSGGGSSRAGGIAFILGAVGALLVYWLLVVLRLGKR
jgi:hypothetical protein